MIKKILLLALVVLSSSAMFAQTTVTGTVKDANTGETLPGANIKISGKSVGTNTDFDGIFTLNTKDIPPFTIEVSMLGYQITKVEVTKNNQKVDVSLTENATSLDEIVVSASRTPERIMESPVTVERMDARAIRNTASASYYDGLENLKGVDINTSSLTFKSVNTRGFATFANTRFMQLVDGMDNAAPSLNFAVGNLLGLSELDVKTVELLPGASSALYGANAFNGIMFMSSKSAFDSPGISFYSKLGATSQEAAGTNFYNDIGVRLAHVFSDKFAAKATISYLNGEEWHATDYRNTSGGKYVSGDRNSDRNYNGVNVYGDAVSTNLRGVANALEGLGILPNGASALIPNESVSRTGYSETDLIDYKTKRLRLGASLNYRPYGDDRLEVIWNSKMGSGNTIYQGGQRYSLQNFLLHQHKLEVKGENFFARAYTTIGDAGDSYNTLFAALNVNRAWKDDSTWFGEYVGGYFLGTLNGLTSDQAHAVGRQAAENGRFLPGSQQFKSNFDRVVADPNLLTGAKFRDETKLYHGDANYNFKNQIDFAEIQVGGSYRRYSLNSFGNIFTDADGPINYDEFGVYTQLQKKFLEDDRLKLTTSIRYDKAQNFDGSFSPRVSLAYAGGENKNQNFRASFQTGFRNPTTQDQYIGLDVGSGVLVGSAPDNLDRFLSAPYTASDGTTVQLTGRDAYEKSFSVASVLAGTPQNANTSLVKPEKVTAYEVGYRGLVGDPGKNLVTVDLSVYYNAYEDFISNKNVLVPLYGTAGDNGASLLALSRGDYKAYQLYTNSAADINSYGAAIGLNTKILGFDLGASYTYAKFDFDQTTDPDFESSFNTPEHKVKMQFGKTSLFKNIGFNVSARWQDEYFWQSTFVDGTIESRTVLDAQVNFRFPEINSTFKIGGSNLTGKEFLSAPGVGAVGSQYYISLSINN